MVSIDLQEEDKVQFMRATETLASGYELVKVWDEDKQTWLIRRKADSQQFLGFSWKTSCRFARLLDNGAGSAVSALLNHANLINIISNVPVQVFGGSKDQVEYFSIWDFCDAGSLSSFMQRPAGTLGVPRPELTACGRVKEFLPESLVWHVAISMLQALAWLHEGYRAKPVIVRGLGDDFSDLSPIVETRDWRAETERDGKMGEDWMPVLHRNISAGNIFFQHPRGSETYGYCKLGNFSKAFVSGHVHNLSGGQVVCSEDDSVTLDTLRKHMAVKDISTVPKNERPYFKSTELYHLGKVLFEMMTSKKVPDREECALCWGQHHKPQDPLIANGQCPLGKHFFVGDELELDERLQSVESLALEYTAGLRKLVYNLLNQEYRGSGSLEVDGRNAIAFLQEAQDGYKIWKTSYADGRLYRDEVDDMLLRDRNKRKEEADGVVLKQ